MAKKRALAAAACLRGGEEFGELGGGLEAGDEAADAGEGKAVEDLEAALFVGDDAGFAEDREVPGNGGPAETDFFDQVADAALFAGECLDDGDASGMPEGLEDFVDGNGVTGGFHGGDCFA